MSFQWSRTCCDVVDAKTRHTHEEQSESHVRGVQFSHPFFTLVVTCTFSLYIRHHCTREVHARLLSKPTDAQTLKAHTLQPQHHTHTHHILIHGIPSLSYTGSVVAGSSVLPRKVVFATLRARDF